MVYKGQINIKYTYESSFWKNKGKYKSTPNVDNSLSVIISKINCNHTGLCLPSQQQQILQRKKEVHTSLT